MHEAATGAEDLNWGLTFLALAYYTLGLKNELSILSPQSSEPGSVSFLVQRLEFRSWSCWLSACKGLLLC